MNLFDLFATITLDPSDYEQGVKKATKESKTLREAVAQLNTPIDKVQNAFNTIRHPIESAKTALEKIV